VKFEATPEFSHELRGTEGGVDEAGNPIRYCTDCFSEDGNGKVKKMVRATHVLTVGYAGEYTAPVRRFACADCTKLARQMPREIALNSMTIEQFWEDAKVLDAEERLTADSILEVPAQAQGAALDLLAANVGLTRRSKGLATCESDAALAQRIRQQIVRGKP
jgi:hypothetical protein